MAKLRSARKRSRLHRKTFARSGRKPEQHQISFKSDQNDLESFKNISKAPKNIISATSDVTKTPKNSRTGAFASVLWIKTGFSLLKSREFSEKACFRTDSEARNVKMSDKRRSRRQKSPREARIAPKIGGKLDRIAPRARNCSVRSASRSTKVQVGVEKVLREHIQAHPGRRRCGAASIKPMRPVRRGGVLGENARTQRRKGAKKTKARRQSSINGLNWLNAADSIERCADYNLCVFASLR